jgi:hypothetical protein
LYASAPVCLGGLPREVAEVLRAPIVEAHEAAK